MRIVPAGISLIVSMPGGGVFAVANAVPNAAA